MRVRAQTHVHSTVDCSNGLWQLVLSFAVIFVTNMETKPNGSGLLRHSAPASYTPVALLMNTIPKWAGLHEDWLIIQNYSLRASHILNFLQPWVRLQAALLQLFTVFLIGLSSQNHFISIMYFKQYTKVTCISGFHIWVVQREVEHLEGILCLIRASFSTLQLWHALSHAMTREIRQTLNPPLDSTLNGWNRMGLIHTASISDLHNYQISSIRTCPTSHFPAI